MFYKTIVQNSVFLTFLPFLVWASPGINILENFEQYSCADTPKKGWEGKDGSPAKVYNIGCEDKNHFLQAQDHGESIRFFKKVEWNMKDHPWLAWKWRVKQFPKDSDERDKKKNDSALGVYILFDRTIIPVAIKYVWSHKVPCETVIRRKNNFPMVVIRSGQEHQNTWVKETRNVLQDYIKFFTEKITPEPIALGFLTDANSSKDNSAAGDYDDFEYY